MTNRLSLSPFLFPLLSPFPKKSGRCSVGGGGQLDLQSAPIATTLIIIGHLPAFKKKTALIFEERLKTCLFCQG